MPPLLDLQRPLLASLVKPLYLGASALILAGAALSVINAASLLTTVPVHAVISIILTLAGMTALLAAIRMLGEIATIAYGLDGNRQVRTADIAAMKETLRK
jgi:hypothetical protein